MHPREDCTSVREHARATAHPSALQGSGPTPSQPQPQMQARVLLLWREPGRAHPVSPSVGLSPLTAVLVLPRYVLARSAQSAVSLQKPPPVQNAGARHFHVRDSSSRK